MTALLTLLLSLPSPNSVYSLPLQFYFVDHFLSFLTPFIFVFYFFLYFIYLFCTHFYVAQALVNTAAEEDAPDTPPDLFAIGFEEIVDLNASNIVSNTQWSENANSWGHELQKVIYIYC